MISLYSGIRTGLLSLFVILTLLFTNTFASVQTFTLENEAANKIIPLIQPLVPQALLSGQGQTLVVRASDSDIAAVKQAINAFDTPKLRFAIELMMGDQGHMLNEGPLSTGMTLHRSVARDQYDTIQRLIVTEGKPALIQQSKQFPILSALPNFIGSAGIAYEEIANTLTVTAVREGDHIKVTLSADRQALSRFGQSSIDGSSLKTDVNCQLGVWTQLGGNAAANQDEGSTTRGFKTGDRQRDNSFFYVKVDIAK